MKLVFVLVCLGFLKTTWIYKVIHALPQAELRRRARAGDKQAEAIYKVAAYGRGVDGLVWLIGVATAIILVLWAARINWWSAAIVVLVMLWLVALAPVASPRGAAWRALAFFAARIAVVLEYMKPLLDLLAHLVPTRQTHYGIYEKGDLLELLKNQSRAMGNRIAEADLATALHALTFEPKKVDAVMVPRAKAKFVLASEPIGPMLMDELHKTGSTRFAVVAEEAKRNLPPKVCGSLYLGDLLKNLESSKKISSLAHNKVAYINEAANLTQALDAMAKTGCLLLVVVNKFQEVAGVISLEDIVQQALGHMPSGDFNDYQNQVAVAGHDPADQPGA